MDQRTIRDSYYCTLTPGFALGLRNTLSKASTINEAVVCVGGGGGLSDDNLVGGETPGDEFEDGSLWEYGGGGIQKTGTVGVLGSALVVELQIVPIDQITCTFVDCTVSTGGVDSLSGEPGGDARAERSIFWDSFQRGKKSLRSMGQDVFANRELLTEGLGEIDEPLLGLSVLGVDGVEIFVVNICKPLILDVERAKPNEHPLTDTVEVIIDDPLGHGVGKCNGVSSSGSGGITRKSINVFSQAFSKEKSHT